MSLERLAQILNGGKWAHLARFSAHLDRKVREGVQVPHAAREVELDGAVWRNERGHSRHDGDFFAVHAQIHRVAEQVQAPYSGQQKAFDGQIAVQSNAYPSNARRASKGQIVHHGRQCR